jgi:GNAT superfamily N-acetyltransferase
MRKQLSGGFVLDDDRARVDLDAVHAFLANESYWARGRPRELVERSIDASARVIGLYLERDGAERQVGFARIVSDQVTFGYLADVYVLDEFRGLGLGVELVRWAVDTGAGPQMRWILGTADAHELYVKLGFGPPSDWIMERPPASDAR